MVGMGDSLAPDECKTLLPPQYYTVPGATPIHQLMSDALVLARDGGYDVFNALNLLDVSQSRAC